MQCWNLEEISSRLFKEFGLILLALQSDELCLISILIFSLFCSEVCFIASSPVMGLQWQVRFLLVKGAFEGPQLLH